ncbi:MULTISPECIES: alpha-L-glutamate ligase-like protein [Oceanimonas]|uniref:Alpha-L-glutamate ligase-like protein n=1 Tax=Oceanimonas doudoroffii TaxID=84158 RepID=A0A233REU2_9GAMM|nr:MULTISPECIES: alpha-L-glutamate ligase-like protein [Oceanimonas]NHI01443.1 Ribosomal protein S6--L-glutamate ligase [Oceanimonas sp. MB9]OXY81924.1 alpha-L-glutamate ligase-like protein [Oceanimonas doudoroffii]
MIKNLLAKYASPFELGRLGIMGMNRRNISYISRYNPRRLYPLVDNKLKTKQIALDAGVTVPEMVGVIEYQHQVAHLWDMVKDWPGFCIKPAKGSGGKGITVIVDHDRQNFTKPSGKAETIEDLERHVSNILAGLYSLGGKPDVALIEALINFDDVFDGFSYEGVPDTRVIVFKGFPIMAMMRLSTQASDGKANLHQGAVGVGLDINTGRAIRAVQFNQPVRHHPDTGRDLFELKVPYWEQLLNLSSSCFEMSGLGYIGTDMVLDKQKGPMLLELNARPGLAIQTANAAGLVPRLRKIEKLGRKITLTPEERVAFSRKEFATDL